MNKKLKPSELMLKGFAMAGGRQCKGAYGEWIGNELIGVCALGAVNLAKFGKPSTRRNFDVFLEDQFYQKVGVSITWLNDAGMSIPDIAGILAAEGL